MKNTTRARFGLHRRSLLLVAAFAFASIAPAQEHHPQPEQDEVRHHTAHHRFEDAESWSRRFDDPERDAWQKPRHVIELMEIEPGMTVADIGAGTGYFLGPLADAVGATGRVLGLDVESSMVGFMIERAAREGWSSVEAREVAPDDPGLASASTDRVLIVNTWHHIGDRGAYSGRLRDALKPGGRVFVVDFTFDSSHGPPPAQRLAPEQVVEELEAGGLVAVMIEEALPDQYIVVGEKR